MTMIQETWRDVPGYEGSYQVSDLGRVKSLPNARRFTELIMKQSAHKRSGHMIVNLTESRGGKWAQKTHWVHRLVLLAFVGPCPNGMEGCHNDGNPKNNRLDNLRWDTPVGNATDRVAHGTHAIGAQNPRAKITEKQALEIKARIAAGETNESIAADYPLTTIGIKSIRNGYSWSHL